MNTKVGNLTGQDHRNMDAFLGELLDRYKEGVLPKQEAVEICANIMAALDMGNIDGARRWFEEGRNNCDSAGKHYSTRGHF